MKFTNTRLKYFCVVVLLFIVAQQKSYGGGFPVRPNSLLLAPSVSYFYANKGWDSTRKLSSFPAGGHFSSISYQLYAEYGISRRFTFVASLPFVTNSYEQTGYKTTATGLTDLETGIRYYIANINYNYYFMVTGTVVTPLYTNPNLGYGQSGAELKFSFAGKLGNKCTFTLENGLRQYFGSEGPFQDRYNGTFGVTVDKSFKNQLAVSFGGFYSKSDFTKFAPNPAINKNFAFNQVSLSYGHSFSREFSVFLTGGKFINGRNTGDGSSGSVSFIIRPF
ncbi:MAG: hypothetical protein JWP37_4504 [Mucilaginibacter sp.]|nr:hypothetical protein [Mucilaginibacter sp.]